MPGKNCLFCGQNFMGRADKKFCNDYCRSALHNQIKSENHHHFKEVDHVLKRNRKILAALFEQTQKQKKGILTRKIQELGFIFSYHTHILPLENGEEGVFCYDYGYIKTKCGELAIIKQN